MTERKHKTLVSLVVAMAENYCIGDKGKMPWGERPFDRKRFYRLTVGKPVIMGRKTFESIGRALPKRTNIILTRNRNYAAPKCVVVHSVNEALAAALPAPSSARQAARSAYPFDAKREKEPEIMVIGGAEIYKLFLPLAERIYLTLVLDTFAGDTSFPIKTVAEWSGWHSTNREYIEKGELCDYKLMFDTLVKIPSAALG